MLLRMATTIIFIAAFYSAVEALRLKPDAVFSVSTRGEKAELPSKIAEDAEEQLGELNCEPDDLPSGKFWCAICLAVDDDVSWKARTLPCGGGKHKFHLRCIQEWLKDKGPLERRCPLCNHPNIEPLSRLEIKTLEDGELSIKDRVRIFVEERGLYLSVLSLSAIGAYVCFAPLGAIVGSWNIGLSITILGCHLASVLKPETGEIQYDMLRHFSPWIIMYVIPCCFILFMGYIKPTFDPSNNFLAAVLDTFYNLIVRVTLGYLNLGALVLACGKFVVGKADVEIGTPFMRQRLSINL